MTNLEQVSQETINTQTNKLIEYVTIETLNPPSQDYGKVNESLDGWLAIRNIETSLERFSGDGSDWDVIVSGTTTLTRDMYYNNLTVTWTLNTTWYRVFYKGICQVAEWGVIQANWNTGSNWSNGSDWVAPQSPTSIGLWWAWGAWGTATASGTIFWTTAWVAWWKGSNWSNSAIDPIFTGDGTNNQWAWWLAASSASALPHSLLSSNWNSGWTGGYTWAWPWQSWGTWSTVTQIKEKITDPLSSRYLIGFDWTNISLFKSWWVWGWWWAWLWGRGWASWLSTSWWWGWWGWWSGASGWILLIRGNQMINNWTIQANWGNWGNGWIGWNQTQAMEGSPWGGWAWGNGWYVLNICRVYQWKWVIQALWGTWWSPWTKNIWSAAAPWSNGADWLTKTITL